MSYLGDRLRIECPNEMLRNLKLGDKADVTITGVVVELIAGKDPKTDEEVKMERGADCCCSSPEPWTPPAALVIDVEDQKVKVAGNEFSKMAEEEAGD